MENKPKKRRATVVIIIMICASVSNIMRSERIATIRGVDIVQLIACGMLIGVLITNLAMSRKINKE